MRVKQVIFLLVGILLFSSCAGNSNAENEAMDQLLVQVDELMASRQFDQAQNLCNEITSKKELKNVAVKDLCKLSLTYIKLSDLINNEENMAKATKCYYEATLINADAVASYFSELPVEDMQYAETLRRLSDAINAPCDLSDNDHVCDDESCQHNEENNNNESVE